MKRGARKRRGVGGRERKRGARKEGRKRDDGDRKCERQRGDAGDRVQLPTYGGEGRLVCSGLFHPREPTTPVPPAVSLFPAFLPPSPLAPSCVLLSSPSSSLLPMRASLLPLHPPYAVFLSLSPQGKTNSPWRVGERTLSLSTSFLPRDHPPPALPAAVVLACAAL